MTDHPITPPHELMDQWLIDGRQQRRCSAIIYALTEAARWGYQQAVGELEAFLEKGDDNSN